MLHNKYIITNIIFLQSLYIWMASQGYMPIIPGEVDIWKGVSEENKTKWEQKQNNLTERRQEAEKIKIDIIKAAEEIEKEKNKVEQLKVTDFTKSEILLNIVHNQYYQELEPECDRIILTVGDDNKEKILTEVENYITEIAPSIGQPPYGGTISHCHTQKDLKVLGKIIVCCPRGQAAELISMLNANISNDKLTDICTDSTMQVSGNDCESRKTSILYINGGQSVAEMMQRTEDDEINMWYKDMVDGKQDGTHKWEKNTEGNNTIVYVLDTGVMAEHPEFGGRVIQGADFCSLKRSPKRPCQKDDDIYDHGTTVAAVIVGETFGLAKKAQVVSVKCSDDVGFTLLSEFLQCMEWAIEDSNTFIAAGKRVIFSISQTVSDPHGKNKESFELLFKKLSALGIVSVIAAGNFMETACDFSPANVGANTLTVGALRQFRSGHASSSVKADHSNFGPCVDIYAPGKGIHTLSANGTVTPQDGTSFATPIVAALVANYLSKNMEATVAQVYHYFTTVVAEDFSKEQINYDIEKDRWFEGHDATYKNIFGPFKRIKFPCPYA